MGMFDRPKLKKSSSNNIASDSVAGSTSTAAPSTPVVPFSLPSTSPGPGYQSSIFVAGGVQIQPVGTSNFIHLDSRRLR